jgi:hypothetical protein
LKQLPQFERTVVYQGCPAERVLLVVGDINGNGLEDVVVASRRPGSGLYWLEQGSDLPWKMHLMDDTYPSLEAGGFLYDLTGNGRLDFVGGSDSSYGLLYWWESPEDPTERWQRHAIASLPGSQSHDQLVADVDGDGRPELVAWCQGAHSFYVYRVPDDPRQSPWPLLTSVDVGQREEGFAFADVDNDGQKELIAGLSWYKINPDGSYTRHQYGSGFVTTRLAVGDLDDDGKVEIYVAEGDASYHRPEKVGRFARFVASEDPRRPWRAEVIHDHLREPHSLFLSDLDGDGKLDAFVGELGDPNGKDAGETQHRVFQNTGGGFREIVIDRGVSTHEAKPITVNGRACIVGKPYRNLAATAVRTTDVDQVHLWTPVT